MNDYDKIIEIITAEIDLFEQLINIMHKKKEQIISMNIDDLQKTLNEEIKLLAKTRFLENKRLDLVKSFYPQKNNIEKLPLSELIKEAPAKESKILSELKFVLKSKLDEIKRINDSNRILIERSKKFIKENISILTCAGERQLVNKKV